MVRSALKALPSPADDTSMDAPLNAAQVLDCRHRLTPIACLLPAIDLAPAERMALSGHLFLEAPELIARVLGALGDAPELYARQATDPVLPAETADLRGRHERALALRCVHHGLMILARRAADLALLDQAEVTARCQEIVRTAREDAEGRPGPDADERYERLRAADLMLRRRAGRRSRGRTAAASRRRAAPGALAARRADALLEAVGAGIAAKAARPSSPPSTPLLNG